jgi:hypothetical protein
MKSIFLRTLLIAIFLSAVCFPAIAEDCNEKSDPCGKQTGWNEFEMVRLRMKQTGIDTPAQWVMRTSRVNFDLQVDIDFPDPKSPQSGTLMMVEGRTLISKGVGFKTGREIDALDVPALYVILTGKVLSRALPDGPEALKGRRAVMHEDKKVGIQFATPSAQGFIPPPWSVSGTVIANADGSRDFDLVLNWTEEGKANVKRPMTMSLVGQLTHNSDFKLDNNMSLVGWNVFGVGPIVEKAEGATRYDYGAKPMKTIAKTIADIRAAIAIENSPGEPDATRNFAGFWKTACADTFGLRIKPADSPHMYTVTFCGPGGCGDETNERKTFIKGDKQYSIVSGTELQVGKSENRTTYKKCSNKMLP